MSTKSLTSNFPSLSSEGGLSLYLAQIKKFPILDAEEEYMLAKNWKDRGNLKSAHKLVTSHLRLVAKINAKRVIIRFGPIKSHKNEPFIYNCIKPMKAKTYAIHASNIENRLSLLIIFKNITFISAYFSKSSSESTYIIN